MQLITEKDAAREMLLGKHCAEFKTEMFLSPRERWCRRLPCLETSQTDESIQPSSISIISSPTMEPHSRDDMELKEETAQVWSESAEQEQNTAQVHFVPEGGTVAQIVYSDDQDRPPQQVVYTADGTSYTSTLFTDPSQVAYVQQDADTQQVTVLLPAAAATAAQSVNPASLSALGKAAEPPQQRALEQGPQADRVTIPVHNQVLPSLEAEDDSSPLETLQNQMESMEAKEENDDEDEDDDEDEEEDEEEEGEDTDMDEWDPDPPRPFDPNDLWCEECNNAHPSVCPKHGPLHPIPNRPVLTRARASLPLVLYIDRFLGGVYSKRRIPKRTQFGPVEGPLVRQSELKDFYIHLKVSLDKSDRKDRDLQEDLWFELSSEALCNWMMFVRPAQNHLEQNLVAYQYGHHIYYTTIKNVEPKQELKVWYAASYADFVNQKIHDISEEERKVLREQEKNWPCYECNRRFMSSEQLQQHLNSHDEKLDFFSSKGQFDEAGQATLNGLDQQEQTPVPPETPPSLEQQPESHPLQLQPHEPTVVPTQSTMTADDMRQAKRIRNAALQHLFIRKSFRPFRCLHCGKAFRDKDKLDQHLRFHGREGNCPLTCDICNKVFINSSALESHMKFHLDQKTYSCIFCPESFDRLDLLKDHVAIHVNDGCFTCPSCKKRFPDFIQVKKHVRSFHSEKIYQCTECDKAFCRPDKLRLHMLRHSDRKDFLCSTCGKQFKRKDKLREHMQRMHNPEREAKKADRISRSKTFKPRIASTDYESFMFKCRLCMMGFRRRGMLVNHLSKRHPDMKIEEVPELTLPIIKPNRDYFCQYCDKVYKSASKRKAHILKNHPGAELPPSIRKLRPAGPGEPDPMLSTHTQLTGTIETPPVCCPHCSKQYSSKTKMVQHIRKKHPEFAQIPTNTIHVPLTTAVISAAPTVLTADSTAGETVVTTDLLTQAMTELSQTLTTDFRTPQGEYQRIQYIPVSQSATGLQQPQHIQLQVVQVAQATSPHQSQHSTVDVGQLHDPQAYTQHAIQVQHIQVAESSPAAPSSSQVGSQPLSPSSQPSQQELSPSQMQTSTSSEGQALQAQEGSSVQQAYLSSQWHPFRSYSSEIQMMIPQGPYVIAEPPVGTPVTTVNTGQVKVAQTQYVIAGSQPDLDVKPNLSLSSGVEVGLSQAPAHSDSLESQAANPQPATQYIITTTTNEKPLTLLPFASLPGDTASLLLPPKVFIHFTSSQRPDEKRAYAGDIPDGARRKGERIKENRFRSNPLELGPTGDGNGSQIMEDCMLGSIRISLPEDLLEDPEIFFEVVSLSTWEDVLVDSQREHLKKFLPHFPENNTEHQNDLIMSLFSGENFRFGNPLHIAQKLFRDGHFNPEVVKYRQLCFKSQYKRYLSSQQQYFYRLLKQILASRNHLLELARKGGPDLALKRKYAAAASAVEERDRHTHRRYLKILREVKEECGDTALSSDEEDLTSWIPSSPAQCPSPAVPLRVIPTLSAQDMKTADKLEFGESDLKVMLKKHHEKRKRQPNHPDLMTGDLTLNDIVTRVNAGRKGSLAALFDLAVLKKKVKEKEEKKKKKLKVIKSEAEDLSESLGNPEGMPPMSQDPSPIPLISVKEEPLEDIKPCLGVNEISSSFFSLLRDILLLEGPSSLSVLEDKVMDWQSSPASTLNNWFSSAPNWSELVLPALQYLTGDSRDSSQDHEKELAALFQLWLETKDQTFFKDNEDSSDGTTPVPRVRTDYVVRPSTGEEKRVFQEQERYRYSQPHKAFTFRMHGFDSVVGPVKGVFDKETSLNKAREHSLLRSDRPAYVTILSLVRDAAARLPNGEGTRAEICELLKDSQFLAPDVTSAQVNTVVSGALDRLHYEKDPCVKYDIGRKLWIYLHRDRSEEEFERIHQAQAAAAKAKKALQQKPKPPAKIKASNKESSVKVVTSGTSEPSQLSLSDSSMPPTPVTPTAPPLPAIPISPPPVPVVSKSLPNAPPEQAKPNQSILLVSSPTMPQLGTLLSTAQSTQSGPQQPPPRTPSHTASSGLPQVRVVTAQSSLPAVPQPAPMVAQQKPPPIPQIRVPATASQTKVLPQAVMTVPVKAQTSSVQVQRPAVSVTGPAAVVGAGLSSAPSPAPKPAPSSLGSSTPNSSAASSSPSSSSPSTTVVQNMAGQNIIKQVAITGQLGMKSQPGGSLPLAASNFRIQSKDVLRLPPSSITTDAKGQTVLRITPDMMATLAKSQVTTVKLTQDLFAAAAATGSAPAGKGISATLHVTSSPIQPSDSPAKTSTPTPSASASPVGPTVVKVTPDLKTVESAGSAFRLMPALGMAVAEQKGKALSTVASAEAKPAATIRIVQGVGMMPPKVGQTITVATHAKQMPSSAVVSLPGAVHTSAVSLPAMTASVSKAVTVVSGAAGTPITLGAGSSTMRQVPVSTTVVSTTQAGKLPARITVPLSVLSQPVKGKSVVTAPIIKGNLGANISGLGRNIILTTMPAGTKLIAGNKPVSFLTAQQLQQLHQQGQATQVRIQTVPASHLQQGTMSGSTKAVSTVVVTAAPSPKQTQDQQ
ncbi:hypothetical protein lerEdw1_004476 [Lerista edwardsae]|nr:hypothetical protein lerEdw1_004476 [Lerista edwardsae]